jgi:hypothetical protein
MCNVRRWLDFTKLVTSDMPSGRNCGFISLKRMLTLLNQYSHFAKLVFDFSPIGNCPFSSSILFRKQLNPKSENRALSSRFTCGEKKEHDQILCYTWAFLNKNNFREDSKKSFFKMEL